MTTVMGVDLGIAKVAYSIWEGDILVETEAFDTSEMTPKRQKQLSWISTWLMGAAISRAVDYIFIEDTLIGNNRKYSIRLSQTMGAVLAGIGLIPGGPEVILVNVGQWKKDVIGNGHATKQMVQEYILSRGSAYSELCGGDQDRFDAACIGYYGVQLSARADGITTEGGLAELR